MDIIQLVTALEETESEIKTTRERLVALKKRRDETERCIIEFLAAHNQPGFVYKDKIYAPKNVNAYRKKRVQDKQAEISNVLKRSGLDPDADVIADVFNVFKHQRVHAEKLSRVAR